ncbi:prepilin peptidase [Thalassomonas sp. M1454]|uniref:A24 family peptidase n=1 Tax=Thalassomonas sp. M1454 TaxID=2594477 RepID=UPI00117F9947|nr:A24 family peptidase [Thalassomonas sp. M1454]TRX54446.1 prepilin peptidase [Thalassomonas sp. M1454]
MTEFEFGQTLILIITFAIFTIALIYDLKFQRIPNSLCFVTILIGVVLQIYFLKFSGLITAVLGFVVAFIILFPAFYIKALGGGDVKLMMAIGVLIGPMLIGWSIVYAILVGGFLSLLLTIYKTGFKGIKATLVRYYHCFYLRTYFKPGAGEAASLKVPYAPALALGWLLACSQNKDVLSVLSNFKYVIFS